MPLADFLALTLGKLEAHYHQMGGAFDPPIRAKVGNRTFFRHEQQSDVLLCYLKGVKLVSTLNAALVLFRHGYAQEVGALCRMADDFFFEIMFFVKPLGDNAPSKDQQRMFDDFFREEFENPDDPLGTKVKGARVEYFSEGGKKYSSLEPLTKTPALAIALPLRFFTNLGLPNLAPAR